jgi:hypothetical protein
VAIYQYYGIIKTKKRRKMREDWVAYVVVFSVVALMLLGKKMIFFESKDKKDTHDKS